MLLYLFLVVYFFILITVFIYASHRYYMVYLYYRHQKDKPVLKKKLSKLPRVTIQLPIYNEMYVARRLITSSCDVDYPRELLDIQVLDDSTDETTVVALECVKELKEKGFDVQYIHRVNREGFKGGALSNGLKSAKGEFISVFDADFVPQRDILQKTIHYFSDSSVGMVQTRWTYLNRSYSFLTKIQAIMLDGHFVIEHTARNWSGRFFNFNGTAGIWRKEAIIKAGGWQNDTLTEDLDLSYRAQLKGWKFIFLKDELSPSEIPVEINGFKSQQHRWAKGSIQTAKKLLPQILRSKLPLKVKVEAFFHLTNNMSYLLMLLLSVLIYPSMVARINIGWFQMIVTDVPFLLVATVGISFFYTCSQKEAYKDWKSRLLYLPMLMSLGIGLSVNNSKAVLEAVFNKKTEFKRTPKFSIEKKRDRWLGKKYRGEINFVVVIELLLGIYFTFNVYFAYVNKIYISIPFLMMFQVGYFYVAFLSIFQVVLSGIASNRLARHLLSKRNTQDVIAA
ncbi:MAG TPA: glycosyltransferase [Nitrospirae bacterium]|nr:beta-monoglucosyldiacylglycerol synthase [bacterium BMS3Abin06]HDH11823.1 glycosyltransferase [Nitrospirota bacterium]HDZ02835.1 glycosyltransferase [Nitrospirota bacterium]